MFGFPQKPTLRGGFECSFLGMCLRKHQEGSGEGERGGEAAVKRCAARSVSTGAAGAHVPVRDSGR